MEAAKTVAEGVMATPASTALATMGAGNSGGWSRQQHSRGGRNGSNHGSSKDGGRGGGGGVGVDNFGMLSFERSFVD
jgi:hypothetical protein